MVDRINIKNPEYDLKLLKKKIIKRIGIIKMSKTNKQVIEDFVNGRNAKNMNLTSIDGSLYSYNFKIAENNTVFD